MKGMFVAALFAGAAAVCLGGPAQAKTWSFSFAGLDDSSVYGSGWLTTGASGSPYAVTGAVGKIYDGESSAPFTIKGLSSYAGADNLLYFPSTSYVSFGGLSFATTAGEAFNLGGGGWYAPQNLVLNGSTLNPGGYPQVGFGAWNVSLTMAAVPEPSTWVLFGLGFATLGFAAIRRRRTPIAAFG